MIYIDNIRGLETNVHLYNEVWCIMRTPKYAGYGIRHVRDLSPSWNLFRHYDYLKSIHCWNQEVFNSDYVPAFISELKNNATVVNSLLNELYLRDKHGYNIALGCSCNIESMCHRSIIAGLLQGAGVRVCLPSNADYRRYYDMYKLN